MVWRMLSSVEPPRAAVLAPAFGWADLETYLSIEINVTHHTRLRAYVKRFAGWNVLAGRPSMKKRLDILLVERGLAETRERAQALILAGDVSVNGRPVNKAGAPVDQAAELAVRAPLPYVSRGGYKLAGALDEFGGSVEGKVCADIGASTGGFTDVLLQRGAARVYAIDVGYGQLAWKLRQDPRVIVMDRVNARYLESLPEPLDLVVIDVSFISLELILRVAQRLLKPTGEIVALIKPQFEAGRERVGRGGIVREVETHRLVLEKIARVSEGLGLRVLGLARSSIQGTEGNVEFLIHLTPDASQPGMDVEAAIRRVLGS
jgi:23S rRNA (cytidine1920-2'-O)/16S rRNA (cytidine1409-2'-O)-methyltransferase